jgi:hypothetical protein
MICFVYRLEFGVVGILRRSWVAFFVGVYDIKYLTILVCSIFASSAWP